MIYQILVPASYVPGTALETGTSPVAIADKFSWAAALLPPVWALVHRLWLELAAILFFMIGLDLAASYIGAEAAFWIYVAAAVWLGFEAPQLRAGAYTRKNFSESASLLAPSADLAVLKFLRQTDRSAATHA